MKTNFLSQTHDIELGRILMGDPSQPVSDSPLAQTPEARRDNMVAETSAGRAKRSLYAAFAVGGTLLGGSLVAAVAVPTLKQQRNNVMAQRDSALSIVHGYETILNKRSSLDAWVDEQVAQNPFWDDVEGSTGNHPGEGGATSASAIGYASCKAPKLETFVPAALPINHHSDIGQFVAPGPLFRNGLPRPGDQALALAKEPHFNDDGFLALMESLVGMRPEFLASNFRVDGSFSNGTRVYSARLFRRETVLSTPKQAWVSTQARSHVALDLDVAVWPLVAQGGWRAANWWSTSASQGDGDYFDDFGLNRYFATTISGSSLDAVPLNRWAIDSVTPNSTSATADAAAAFADKDDNIPFLVEMLRVNPLIFGTVGFDLDSFALLPNSNATLKDGSIVRRSSDLQLSFEPVGAPAWTVETAGNYRVNYSEYAIVDTHVDGLSLRRALDGPDHGNRFLSYEAMIYAATRLNVGRIRCTDSKLLISES